MNDVLSATDYDETMRKTIDIHPTEAAVNAGAVRPFGLTPAGAWTPSRYDRALNGRRLR
jgi:hypothetical protein